MPAGDWHPDEPKLTDAELNLSASFGVAVVSPPADTLLRDGDIYEAAGLQFEVRETPGHSIGHVVFIYRGEPVHVFGGDVLFAGSVGRIDIPDGDFEALATGIRGKLYTLPDDTIVLPGHGPTTTIGREKRTNPFVRHLSQITAHARLPVEVSQTELLPPRAPPCPP